MLDKGGMRMKFDVHSLEDISVGLTKRLSVKILVQTDNKEEIKAFLPGLIKELKGSSYSKPRTKERFGSSPYQVVYVNIYTHIRQVNYGLPMCTVQWVDVNAYNKPNLINHTDSIDDILIQWNSFHSSVDEMVVENEVPGEQFLQKTKLVTKEALEIALELNKFNKLLQEEDITVADFKEKVNVYSKKLASLENIFIGFPKSEDENLVGLQNASKNAISALHNVLVVTKNDSYPEGNFVYLVNMYLEESMQHFNEFYTILKPD